MYLTASQAAVETALVREEKGVQYPVYYVSQVLKGAKTRYLDLKIFVPSLVTVSRKLR